MEIYLEESFQNRTVKIWVETVQGFQKTNLSYCSKKGQIIQTPFNQSEINKDLKPLIELPKELFLVLVGSLVNYNQHNRVVPDKEDFLKGKLTATETHLTDSVQTKNHLLEIVTGIFEKWNEKNAK